MKTQWGRTIQWIFPLGVSNIHLELCYLTLHDTAISCINISEIRISASWNPKHLQHIFTTEIME